MIRSTRAGDKGSQVSFIQMKSAELMLSLMILTLMVRSGEMTPNNITTTASYERLVVDSDNISQ